MKGHHTAYLMLLIDPRWPEPKVVDARIMSDSNPTTRSGCFWASLAGCDASAPSYDEAHRMVEKLLAESPLLGWVRKVIDTVVGTDRRLLARALGNVHARAIRPNCPACRPRNR